MTMQDILNTDIGVLLGIIAEKNNQYEEIKHDEKNEVVQGTADMLMNM